LKGSVGFKHCILPLGPSNPGKPGVPATPVNPGSPYKQTC